jgi:hypothetical protein
MMLLIMKDYIKNRNHPLTHLAFTYTHHLVNECNNDDGDDDDMMI